MRVIAAVLMHALECSLLGPLREVYAMVFCATLDCVDNMLASVEHVDDGSKVGSLRVIVEGYSMFGEDVVGF